MNAAFSFVPGFMTMLLIVIILSIAVPSQAKALNLIQDTSNVAIAILFFLHGCKIGIHELLKGLKNWKIHIFILSSTFILFPFIGLLIVHFFKDKFPPTILLGIIFLCSLPSTVQSSIAFTSMARGNVAVALCSASLSSILGIILTPLLLILLTHGQQIHSAVTDTTLFSKILFQLLVPVLLGLLIRPHIIKWIARYSRFIKIFDQATVLLVVYLAFSNSVSEGLWQKFTANSVLSIGFIDCAILAAALITTYLAPQLLKFNQADSIAILFCGSKKSLVSGIPLANILLPNSIVGAVLLPLILFHQIQLVACSVIARIYANRCTQGDTSVI